jgi:hypothetical protein
MPWWLTVGIPSTELLRRSQNQMHAAKVDGMFMCNETLGTNRFVLKKGLQPCGRSCEGLMLTSGVTPWSGSKLLSHTCSTSLLKLVPNRNLNQGDEDGVIDQKLSCSPVLLSSQAWHAKAQPPRICNSNFDSTPCPTSLHFLVLVLTFIFIFTSTSFQTYLSLCLSCSCEGREEHTPGATR